jgi:hypothetical protein
MPPRTCVERPIANPVVEMEMRELLDRLDSMEKTQIKTPNAGDVIDAESEEIEVEEYAGEDVAK